MFIDANPICFFDDEREEKRPSPDLSWAETIRVMRQTQFPAHIPVVDLVAGRTLFDGTPDADRWRSCHAAFVAASPRRRGLTVAGSGHYIFKSNPELVILTVATSYAQTVAPGLRAAILERIATYSMTAINDVNRRSESYRHSEDDLNSWGYDLMKKGDLAGALATLTLCVTLYPRSANAYDSLADCYERLGSRKRPSRITGGPRHWTQICSTRLSGYACWKRGADALAAGAGKGRWECQTVILRIKKR